MAAEQIVNVCRVYGKGQFHVIVPKMAKSACTVICLGAQSVLMGPTAELGPIDPQVRQPEGGFFSASSYVARYNKLMDEAARAQGNIEPFLMNLKAFDPVLVEELEREIELSKKVAQDVLFSGMWSDKERAEDETAKLAVFTRIEEKGSHGRPILFSELKRIGLDVEQAAPDSDLWGYLWELYNRALAALSSRCSKLIETTDVSIMGPPARENHEPRAGKQSISE